MKKEISIEEAKKIIAEYPDEDTYVQAHYQQYLRNGEHYDNTCDTSNYWNRCNKIVKENQTTEPQL